MEQILITLKEDRFLRGVKEMLEQDDRIMFVETTEDSVFNTWNVRDVLDDRPDLSNDEALHVLQYADRKSELTWSSVMEWAEILYPESSDSEGVENGTNTD